MRLFEKLRALRAFEKQQLDFLSTVEDHHLIGEIGYHQAKGKPLTLKQLFLLDVGSIATVQRRLRRFKGLGLVQHRRAASDHRAVELTLSPKCLRIFAKYNTLMPSKPPARDAARASGEPSHVCGLCDSDAGRRNLLVTFLAQGLKRGDRCLLVAPAENQSDILAELHPRRKAPEQLVVSEGYKPGDAQPAFLKRLSQEAKQAGQTMRLAADMSWTLSRNLGVDAMLDIEMQLDVLAKQLSLTGLCVYDARRFSSGDFLRAVKCHRDHSRYPIVLG
ncbi:MAG TPA: MEDS domain-containing protein [Burkholderiales bacterium]|nr:MEDS domain-containing protein [Burkholderiales bacterium]